LSGNAWSAFLKWIEASALGASVRDWGVWAYGTINLFHILGIATLFGAILVLDLRLIGWSRSTSVNAIVSSTVPIAVGGFLLAAASGVCLLATNGSEYIGNPFLPIKFVAVALGVLNALALTRTSAWKSLAQHTAVTDETVLKLFGGLSLVFWFAAITCGRLVGYW
jgi:hypothetical protein